MGLKGGRTASGLLAKASVLLVCRWLHFGRILVLLGRHYPGGKGALPSEHLAFVSNVRPIIFGAILVGTHTKDIQVAVGTFSHMFVFS